MNTKDLDYSTGDVTNKCFYKWLYKIIDNNIKQYNLSNYKTLIEPLRFHVYYCT